MAWHYVKYSDDQKLADAELKSRTAKRGLWADPKPMPPWDWRRLSKEEKASATPLALVPAVSLTRIGSGRGNQISYQYQLEEIKFPISFLSVIERRLHLG